jgi:hypothetical protein
MGSPNSQGQLGSSCSQAPAEKVGTEPHPPVFPGRKHAEIPQLAEASPCHPGVWVLTHGIIPVARET